MKTNALTNLILAWFLVTPAYGMPPNTWEPEQSQEASDKLKFWLKGIQEQIQKRPEFLRLTKKIGDKIVYCTFGLGKHGEVVDLKISSSGSDSIDRAAVELVRKTAPFKSPPTELQYHKRVEIKFWNNPSNVYPGNPSVLLAPSKDSSLKRFN